MGKARRQAAERQRKKRQQKIIVCFTTVTIICAVAIVYIAYTVVIPYVSDMKAFHHEQASLSDLSPFDTHWLEINPDYAGWLKIQRTRILGTSFSAVCRHSLTQQKHNTNEIKGA